MSRNTKNNLDYCSEGKCEEENCTWQRSTGCSIIIHSRRKIWLRHNLKKQGWGKCKMWMEAGSFVYEGCSCI
jgi:hypothetical protein